MGALCRRTLLVTIEFPPRANMASFLSIFRKTQTDDGKSGGIMSKGISMMSLIKVDTDALLFQSLVAVILLAALWPLSLVRYLVSVYGSRILAG